mgnify:CR=1 FL=1
MLGNWPGLSTEEALAPVLPGLDGRADRLGTVALDRRGVKSAQVMVAGEPHSQRPGGKVEPLVSEDPLDRPRSHASAAQPPQQLGHGLQQPLGDAGALDPEQKMYAVERLIVELATVADQHS